MTSIAPAKIQSELSRLWETQKETKKIRASLFNLIFFTELNERTDYVRTLVHKVIEKFPSRVLFITHKPGEDSLTARVSVIPGAAEDADFACDLIEIETSGNAIQRAFFLLLPHLLPDLPITTVWASEPTPGHPLLDQLSALSQKLIFDSGVTQDLSKFAHSLKQISQKCDIADLSWARIENWRRLLSATFHSPERLSQLNRAKQLHILYNSVSKPVYQRAEFQALYLQGWLASQLGWKRGSVEILLTPEEQPHLSPGSVLSLDLTTSDECHFSFGRDLHFPHQICMRFSTLELCDIPLKYIFSKGEVGRALVKEIGHQGTSPHFLKLLDHLHVLPTTHSRG